MKVKTVNPRKYRVAGTGNPLIHRNLEWFATDDDSKLGVVLEDLVDHDFSWVLFARDASSTYNPEDMGHSLATQEVATEELHTAMRKDQP